VCCVYIIISPHFTTGQYTTGGDSFGVGLKAAVMRDPLKSQMILGKSSLYTQLKLHR